MKTKSQLTVGNQINNSPIKTRTDLKTNEIIWIPIIGTDQEMWVRLTETNNRILYRQDKTGNIIPYLKKGYMQYSPKIINIIIQSWRRSIPEETCRVFNLIPLNENNPLKRLLVKRYMLKKEFLDVDRETDSKKRLESFMEYINDIKIKMGLKTKINTHTTKVSTR